MTTRPDQPRTGVSRLAPSPTGALHLGNVRTFLINWALAQQRGWRLLLRIEDIDGPRVKPESIVHTIDVLAWIGLTYDGAPVTQSEDLEPYRTAMRALAGHHAVFACTLSRREIEQAASAPHGDEHELRFAPELRPAEYLRHRFSREDHNYRLITADRDVIIDDAVAGRCVFNPGREVGDFVVWTKRAMPAYQLAVVVDDARQGVTDVVRGDDLLPSAARQTLLYERLGLTPPRWWHVPLVLGPDGRRLAKRHGDTRIETYRQAGVSAERIMGLMAYWCGMVREPEPMKAIDFKDAFRLEQLPRHPVLMREDDHRWLLDEYS